MEFEPKGFFFIGKDNNIYYAYYDAFHYFWDVYEINRDPVVQYTQQLY